MASSATVVSALFAVLLPATALAQAASPETQLQQEMRHRRAIVRPVTPPEQVERDANQAADDIERQRDEAAARALTRPAQRPPQADQDLTGGIQTRNLNNTLRR
jgi:hypothetical protein